MILTDFHVHSSNSSDAIDSMQDMALAARDMGVGIMCFTDHCDIDAYPTGLFNPNCFDMWGPTIAEYKAMMSDCPANIDIRIGLELGEANHAPLLADKISAQKELDFVIGSIHSLLHTQDFCELTYRSEEQCIALLHEYLDELHDLAGLDSFDCIGHIGYTYRYMSRSGFRTSVEDACFREQVDRLLRRVIERGKGIELNCSGLRRADEGWPLPGASILTRYLELGGEIITIGSDAHCISDCSKGLVDGMEILRELGYRYITVFKNRQPEFLPI